MKKHKKLRDLYNEDPAAKKFLEDHPEFDDRFLEQTEKHNPGFNINEGRYRLYDVSEDQKNIGDLELQALAALPEKHPDRHLLEAYFIHNESIRMLAKRYKKNDNTIRQRIFRAREEAFKIMRKKKLLTINGGEITASRVFRYKNQVKTLYLVNDVWVLESGEILSEDIQQILDENPEYKEWDEIYL